MQLTRFTDPVQFYDHVSPFLSEHEAENNLLLGIIKGLGAGEYKKHSPYLVCAEQDEEIVLVAVRTPPLNVLLSNSGDAPTEAIHLLAEDVYQNYGEDVPGIVGMESNATIFSTKWYQLTGRSHKPKMGMRIYKLTEVTPVNGVTGAIRLANEADSSLISQWISGFHQDAFHETLTKENVESLVERFLTADLERRGLMVLEVDGEPVSMAGYMGPTPHGMRIGAVYTPPEQRKKGYASAVTAGISQHILDSGREFCFLFTDLSNPTSNHIYQEIGYRPVRDVVEWEFE